MAILTFYSQTGTGYGLRRAAGIVLALLFLLLTGCASSGLQQPRGGLVRSDEVRKTFESSTVLPDHVYYYSGPEAEPEAIIAIREGFTLQGSYWHRVDQVQGHLQSWNRRIDNAHRIRNAYVGARIMTPDGREAGIWFSLFDHTVIRFPDAQTIHIYAPGPPLRHDFRDDFPDGIDSVPRN